MNRLAWAVVYLKRAEMLTSTARGIYRVTDRGKSLVSQKPNSLTVKSLLAGYSSIAAQQQAALPSTPEEQFENSYAALRETLAHEVLDRVKQLSPSGFERLVVDLLIAMGYGGTLDDPGQVVGKSGDGGIDGTIRQDKLGLDMVYVQAKQWQNNVGRPDVQKFCGSIIANQTSKGVMIATSEFSKEAREYVRQIPQKIILLGGRQLAELMIDHEVGVEPAEPKRSFTLRRLDEDYFEAVDSATASPQFA